MPASDAPAPGRFNDADVTFAQSMIPRHQQAVEMAQPADGRASDPEIKSLASKIEKAQDPEITTMRAWLKSWDKPESGSAHGMDHGSGDMEGMDHSGMAGMMSKKDMAGLEAAKGTDFDKKFARMLIAHHEGAINMAEDEQSKGRNATAKELAGVIIKAQTAEIEQMKALLERL
ncbi:DUF305 domain-containing protein [Streptomyces meridianus]|uniref:DUF305 domain-containing protein n=1 Tax=Streptomyces meridianus TaxID=2938945 RepID=UPI0027E2FA76|nr:DUF305 domain-containing protein [Streptomyces meridianus]